MNEDDIVEYVVTVAAARHFMRLRQTSEAKRRCRQAFAIRFNGALKGWHSTADFDRASYCPRW